MIVSAHSDMERLGIDGGCIQYHDDIVVTLALRLCQDLGIVTQIQVAAQIRTAVMYDS